MDKIHIKEESMQVSSYYGQYAMQTQQYQSQNGMMTSRSGFADRMDNMRSAQSSNGMGQMEQMQSRSSNMGSMQQTGFQSSYGMGGGMSGMATKAMLQNQMSQMGEMQGMGRPMGGGEAVSENLSEEELGSAEETLTTQTGKALSELTGEEVEALAKDLLAQLAVLKGLDTTADETVAAETVTTEAATTAEEESVAA